MLGLARFALVPFYRLAVLLYRGFYRRPTIRFSKMRAAWACMPGRTCWNMSMVNTGLLWPRRSETTLTGDTFFDQQRAVGVTQVMEPYPGDTGPPHDPFEGL